MLAIECVVFCSVVWTGKMEEGLVRRGDPGGGGEARGRVDAGGGHQKRLR